MKQLIVALALFILFLAGAVYQGDYSRARAIERDLKQKAEDSAGGAVLCINPLQYAEGYIVFDDDKVIRYVRNTLYSETMTQITIFDETMRKYKDGILVSTKDDISYPYFFVDENGYSVLVEGPSVAVTVTRETGDLYRLPFLEKTEITRSSMYTFEGRK